VKRSSAVIQEAALEGRRKSWTPLCQEYGRRCGKSATNRKLKAKQLLWPGHWVVRVRSFKSRWLGSDSRRPRRSTVTSDRSGACPPRRTSTGGLAHGNRTSRAKGRRLFRYCYSLLAGPPLGWSRAPGARAINVSRCRRYRLHPRRRSTHGKTIFHQRSGQCASCLGVPKAGSFRSTECRAFPRYSRCEYVNPVYARTCGCAAAGHQRGPADLIHAAQVRMLDPGAFHHCLDIELTPA
jgi:hypothetical protein